MVTFTEDEELAKLGTIDDRAKLSKLLSYLCGQPIHDDELGKEAKQAIDQVLARSNSNEVRLSLEELNELLLLFNQHRVARPFFDFFFLQKWLAATEPLSVPFGNLRDGVRRFRGFAMLCFGNFRFAFRALSSEKDWQGLLQRLSPWTRNPEDERCKFANRQNALTPLLNSGDEISRAMTWLLGYISSGFLKADGSALERKQQLAGAVEIGGDRPPDAAEVARLKELTDELTTLNSATVEAQDEGKRNTTKYLTWDFLDVYVATSMRQQWEFEETYDFIRNLFLYELRDLPQLRWFDPTQAYSEGIPDKGLVEGLMLRRARCTIYMAQEGDTLGKDSELAATLAQGKPVIAYVPRFVGGDLEKLSTELAHRPVRYFRQRLLTLLADGFFDRPDNRDSVAVLAKKLGLTITADELWDKVNKLLQKLIPFEKTRGFKLIGGEEKQFRSENADLFRESAPLLAAIESRAADNRADTIRVKHPLAMQVHLETGVANGVLVARSAKECAELVRGILLCEMSFRLRILPADDGTEIATVLEEERTRSRFRIVTRDRCLTNSFWNFYSDGRTYEKK